MEGQSQTPETTSEGCDRPAPAQAVAAQCRALGTQVLIVRFDVSQYADCRRLAAEVETTFGRADVLVNNAGTTKFVGLKDTRAGATQ